jgi:sugar lactone lactonase YvrE
VIPLDAFDELAEGLDHPEGVAWNPSDGRVYAGGERGEIYAVTLDGEVRQVGSTGGSLLGIAVDGRGRVYVCDAGCRPTPEAWRARTWTRPTSRRSVPTAPST